jgi:uncharacterized protein DUF1320
VAQITVTDLVDRYGNNVYYWADINGAWNGDPTSIPSALTTQINDAINTADARIDDLLRASPVSFVIPVIDASTGQVPQSVRDCKRKLAGYYLSTARDVRDFDKDGNPITNLYADYQDAMKIIEDLRAKHIVLNVQGQ